MTTIAGISVTTRRYTAVLGSGRVVKLGAPGQPVVRVIGVQGPPGASNAGLEFAFASASTSWTINHNLGVRPAVALFTVGGVEMMGQITHTSVNQAVASFNTPQSGFARIT